jgi:hypothetical protein
MERVDCTVFAEMFYKTDYVSSVKDSAAVEVYETGNAVLVVLKLQCSVGSTEDAM